VRARIVLLGILASLLLAAPARAAFTPPELFIRLMSEGQPASDWMPLASPPVFNWIGGYQIGFRLQPSGVGSGPGNFQTVALTYTGVPDGSPTQPLTVSPYCIGRNGTAGEIQSVVEIPIQYEGNGTYSIAVTLGPGPAQTGCMGADGRTTNASFGVDTHVAPQLVGQPFAFRAKPLPGDPFVGIRADDPPGGFADSVCALDATVQPDGSVTGRKIVPDEDFEPPRQTIRTFPEPGSWSCVSRGVVEGQNDDFERTFLGTPWSAPLRFDVLSDFQRKTSAINRPGSKRPTFEVTAQFAAASAGGKATLKLQRLVRCKRKGGYVFKKLATYKGTFDAKGIAKFRFKRPRKNGFYAGMVTFGGTRFVRPGADPFFIPLGATRRSIRFVRPADYPRC
jgi:hypothetical protein